jgi:hypothetical protein
MYYIPTGLGVILYLIVSNIIFLRYNFQLRYAVGKPLATNGRNEIIINFVDCVKVGLNYFGKKFINKNGNY